MNPGRISKLLPVEDLEPVTASRGPRGPLGMDEDVAVVIARRVMLHLYRGSIEYARLALEEGWESHVADQSPLPTGQELLGTHLAVILDTQPDGQNLRILNMLEGAGIRTVRELLEAKPAHLLSIPNFGRKALKHLSAIVGKLKERVKMAAD